MKQNQKLHGAPHKFSHENPALDCAHEHQTSVSTEKVSRKV